MGLFDGYKAFDAPPSDSEWLKHELEKDLVKMQASALQRWRPISKLQRRRGQGTVCICGLPFPCAAGAHSCGLSTATVLQDNLE